MDLLPAGTRFGLLRHMISSPLDIAIMVAIMLALMAAAMMWLRQTALLFTGVLPREHISDLKKRAAPAN